jgi:hypothetical protein
VRSTSDAPVLFFEKSIMAYRCEMMDGPDAGRRQTYPETWDGKPMDLLTFRHSDNGSSEYSVVYKRGNRTHDGIWQYHHQKEKR